MELYANIAKHKNAIDMVSSMYMQIGRGRNSTIDYSRYFIVFCLVIACFLATTESFAQSYSFSWGANPEPVEGYKLYYTKGSDAIQPFNGTGAIEGSSPINVGKQTAFTIDGLEDNTTYHFALTAYNGTDESGYSQIISVNSSSTSPANPLTVVITTASLQGVAPYSIALNGTSTTGTTRNYSWLFGDGATAMGATVSHTYQIPGIYTLTLTISDASGQFLSNNVVITVTAPADPPVPRPSPYSLKVTVQPQPNSL